MFDVFLIDVAEDNPSNSEVKAKVANDNDELEDLHDITDN